MEWDSKPKHGAGKYLTRMDFFRKAVESSPDPKKALSSLVSSAVSPEELAQSSAQMNMSQQELTYKLIKSFLG